MEQENKKLLLLDLCARLPHGVKCDIGNNKPYTLSSITNDNDGTLIRFKEQRNGFNMEVYLSEVKPYLLPLSSMTIEQKEEERSIKEEFYYSFDANGNIYTLQDFYNKNHIDYRGLIPMGLAIDCTNLNIY